ncbi:MAG: alpha/beta hydrolase [Bacteroidales bacterium]|nr:alpha/beta hydrolase [Bacteroidales bacterium]
MILPEGIKGDLYDGLKGLSEKYGVSIVVIEDVNWNDDMTPWPAIGVFKKAKPFGGRAASFLNKLTNEIIPNTERELGIENAERTLLGVSLSGLFAVWAAFNTDVFANIISISGSLWYDGFIEWMKEQTPSSWLKKVCMLLGEKEKNAKDKRMATVEERTLAAANLLKSKTQADVVFELVEGTHFSPIMPRLERAFEVVFG